MIFIVIIREPWSAKNDKVVRNLFQFLNLSNTVLTKLNQLHELVGNPPLLKGKLRLE